MASECCSDKTYCWMDYKRAGHFIGRLCIAVSLICCLLDILNIHDEIFEIFNINKLFVKKNKDAETIFAGLSIPTFILIILLSIVMMIGIHMKIYLLLLPWLIFMAVVIFIIFVKTFSISFFAAVVHLIILGFFVWAWCGIGIIFKHLHRHSTL